MASFESEISPLSHLCSSACSEPFTIYRNKERYVINSFRDTLFSSDTKNEQNSAKSTNEEHVDDEVEADMFSSYESNEINDQSINHTSTQTNDNKSRKRPKTSHLHRHFSVREYEPSVCRSTITTCTHRGHSYFIHVIGNKMNELVIRDANYIVPHRVTLESGFNIPVTQSSEITHVASIGTSSFGAESNILACAGNKISILSTQTSTFGDYYKLFSRGIGLESKISDLDKKNRILSVHHSELAAAVSELPLCSLTIKMKVKLPSNAVKIATTPESSACPSCVILTESGTVFRWSPTHELDTSLRINFEGRADLTNSGNIYSSKTAWTNRCNLELSHDLNTCYLSHHKDLYTIDFRSGLTSNALMTTSTTISSVKQDLISPHTIYVCGSGRVSVMDTRHMREPALKRYVPDSHEIAQLYRADRFMNVGSLSEYGSIQPLSSGGTYLLYLHLNIYIFFFFFFCYTHLYILLFYKYSSLVVMVGSSPHSAMAHIHCIDKALSPRLGSDRLLLDASARLHSAFLFGCGRLSSKVF